ncbi:MAG: histidine kinase [Bacteroidetes bacterium]|nr:histidine kinase [Bacteroidota bacterium]
MNYTLLYILFPLITACFSYQTACGQDPVYRLISKANGLPSNTVYNILQDKQGFIWMGHDKGLSRYDGKQFKHFASNTQQGKSLSNLIEGRNTIWCQDFTGNVYYVKKDSIVKEEKMQSSGYYTNLSMIKNELLVMAGYRSIQTLNVRTREYSIQQFDTEMGSAISFEKDRVVIMNEENQWVFDGKKTSHTNLLSKSAGDIFFLRNFGGEYYGISKNTYPVISVVKNNSFEALPLLQPGIFVQDVTIIDDLLWISTSSGAWCFGLNMQPAFGGHCFFAGKNITRIIKDREGSYWFGTLDNGVLFVPDINNRLYNYNNEKFSALRISANAQILYAGTSNNRILSFDFFKHQFTSLYKGDANHEVLTIHEDPASSQLLFSSDKVILINRNGRALFELGIAGKSFAPLSPSLYAMAYSGGISVIANQKGTEPPLPDWLQREGLRWETNHFILQKAQSRGRSVVYNERDSILYGATANGLFYFSPRGSGKITAAGKEIYASQLLLDGTTLYAATFSDGLFQISGGTHASSITGKNRPLMKTIYRIFKSEDWLWMVGDGMLQRYDPDTDEVVELTEADGLPRAEIKDVVAINSSLYIATTDGMAELNEFTGDGNKVPPELVINSVLVNGAAVNWQEPLSLGKNDNNIEIQFSLLTYKESDSLLLEYKINKEDWQALPAGSRVIRLSSLSSGNYTVAIRGFNEDGVPSATTATIRFSIAVPFYRKWWFFAGMILLGMAIVYIYFRWRLQNEKKRNELLSQKAKLEQELQQSLLSSIKSQMNPHFLFNALNTIQSYIYTNDKENASQYLGKFSELTRMILDMSNKDIVPLSEEIRALTLYLELEQLRFEEKLVYRLTVDETISTETTCIHSMLIQPYVENAIKHGLLHKKDNWDLLLDFKQVGQYIQVTVEDNGIGRKRSEELNQLRQRKHQSFSTQANQKRLEILNKGLANTIALQITDKQDEQGHAAGTRVVLMIPVSSHQGAVQMK